MGRRFLLFFALSAFFFMIHTRTDASPTKSGTNTLNLGHRNLLQNPEPEKSVAVPPSEKEAPISEEESDDGKRETPAEEPSEKHHSSSSESKVCGGVIIIGFVTANFAAAYCYIRVTRRNHAEAFK